MATEIWVNIGSGNALLPDGTKPLTLILPWINYYIHYKVWDEITDPFLNFNSATIEV